MNIVTGAFGYTGKYIARRLVSMGQPVKTLTNRPAPSDNKIDVAPLNFDKPAELVKSLQGTDTIYNTYWIRFPYGNLSYDRAVENTKTLIRCAGQAGIKRIVHISVTNPTKESLLPYFRGKAMLEDAIIHSGLSYAIIRPTLIFGLEDILINNIAWLLRHFPIFAVPGKGDYRLQPVYAEDLAGIVVDAGARNDNFVMDAVGSETYTFDELVRLIARNIRSKSMIIHTPVGLALFLSKLVGYMVNDVVLTHAEVDGLMAGLLVSDKEPVGRTKLSDWLKQNADRVGTKYASELNRHFRESQPSPVS